jgi:hypothetical protein
VTSRVLFRVHRRRRRKVKSTPARTLRPQNRAYVRCGAFWCFRAEAVAALALERKTLSATRAGRRTGG